MVVIFSSLRKPASMSPQRTKALHLPQILHGILLRRQSEAPERTLPGQQEWHRQAQISVSKVLRAPNFGPSQLSPPVGSVESRTGSAARGLDGSWTRTGNALQADPPRPPVGSR